MFGHHKLYHEGAVARGVIIRLFAEAEHHQVSHYDLLVDVEFDDGTHGHLKERVKAADVGQCIEGDVLPVRYDSKDYSKLVLDLPALEASKYVPKENTGQHSQSQSPLGAGVAGLSALLGGGSMADIIREARRDPQGLRDRLIQQAQATGAQVFVSQSGGMTAEPTMETNPEFQASVQPQAPVQYQMPSQPHKQPEPGDFDPSEEF